MTAAGAGYKSPAVQAGICIAAIVCAHVLFTLVFMPREAKHPFLLSMNPEWFKRVTEALTTDWKQLLFPFEYEPGRIYWQASTIYMTYAAERYLGPAASYLIFSSLLVAAVFATANWVTRSLLFAATVAFMFAFGTQLNYAYTCGSLIPLYLLQTYIEAHFAIGVLLLSGRVSGPGWWAALVASLIVVALATEWWINYAVSVVTAATFVALWSWRHGKDLEARRAIAIVIYSIAVLAAYLLIRLRAPIQYIRKGAEEELITTYTSLVLVVEDVIANFFTFLYMTLDNYLPPSSLPRTR